MNRTKKGQENPKAKSLKKGLGDFKPKHRKKRRITMNRATKTRGAQKKEKTPTIERTAGTIAKNKKTTF